jgi:hypothetical protein
MAEGRAFNQELEDSKSGGASAAVKLLPAVVTGSRFSRDGLRERLENWCCSSLSVKNSVGAGR